MARIRHRDPRPSKEEINTARKRVKKALVERAPEAEKQCKVIVEALAVLRTLQNEVHAVDYGGVALRGDRDDCDEFSDLAGEFIAERKFGDMESTIQDAVDNARRLIEERGDGVTVVEEKTTADFVVVDGDD